VKAWHVAFAILVIGLSETVARGWRKLLGR
jgi:hypothetical protein